MKKTREILILNPKEPDPSKWKIGEIDKDGIISPINKSQDDSEQSTP